MLRDSPGASRAEARRVGGWESPGASWGEVRRVGGWGQSRRELEGGGSTGTVPARVGKRRAASGLRDSPGASWGEARGVWAQGQSRRELRDSCRPPISETLRDS